MNLSELSLEDLVAQRIQFEQDMETAEAGKSLINDEILDRLKLMKMSGVKTKTGYLVSRIVKKMYAQVDMNWCRTYGAIKTVEKPDEVKIKQLIEAGTDVPELKTIVYVSIKDIK